MANQASGWSVLWKNEEWLAVWIGFLIIIVTLLGVKVSIPKYKWTTEGEFKSFASKAAPQLGHVAAAAGQKGEQDLQKQVLALKAALDKLDRKAAAAEAKKLDGVIKAAKDKDLQKSTQRLNKEISSAAGNTVGKVFAPGNILDAIIIGVAAFFLSIIAMALLGHNVGWFITGFPIVYVITWLALILAGNHTINLYGLEYVLWCLFLGLFISNVIGIPEWLKPAVQTEFYIKVGLVILGTRILFWEILEAGALGMIQALLVVGVVWYLCFWIARRLQVDEEFSAILASAVSICGVSAAIATSGAIKGDPKKLSYTTSLVLVCAVPMMVLMPIISKAVGIPDPVAGAWLGGTLDTSGSVVAAGELISETAMKVGVIVKMSQNVLIGVAAFILAVVWTFKEAERTGAERPGVIEIWNRFPKFVLGFIAASILFSFFLDPKTVSAVKGQLTGIGTTWFALAFTSIGLETNFRELTTLGGGRPAAAFLLAQGFNILWTLLLAFLIFGGILFVAPTF
ncbi:MAG: putative sulfate exporter family transporter [Thermodesulfobacteriota bacterium]